MNILITGADGYIASHICHYLLTNTCFNVILIDIKLTKRIKILCEMYSDRITLYIVDMTKLKEIENLFINHNISFVFHLAAKIIVSESVEKPLEYYNSNVIATFNLCETMIKYKCKYIIFASTGSICTDASKYSPYTETKVVCEKMLQNIGKAHDFHYVILRFFNVAGVTMDCDLGIDYNNSSHLIPNILKNIYKGKEIFVYGNNYDTPDGTCIRDYIHVLDIAHAYLQSLYYLLNQNESGIFEIGYGTGSSVIEIIRKCYDICNETNMNIKILDKRPGDAAILISDNKKSIDKLHLQFKYDIDSIIKSEWLWLAKQVKSLKFK